MKPLKECSKDELINLVQHYTDREKYFANLLQVADAGQYRADWDAAILRLTAERDRYKRLYFGDEAGDEVRGKLTKLEGLQDLLIRAKPFTEGHPLYKEIAKFLSVYPDQPPFVDALEAALVHLMVWHHRYPDDLDDGEKMDLNWILKLLDKPKRYQGIPDK